MDVILNVVKNLSDSANVRLLCYPVDASLMLSMTIFCLPNFLSEGVRCGLDKEKERMGHTIAYFPFALWIERSQMAPYRKKLIFQEKVVDATLGKKNVDGLY